MLISMTGFGLGHYEDKSISIDVEIRSFNSKELTIFLVNGIKLEGTIIAMGSNSFLLKRDDNIQLVYKHSISTILPLASTNFID